MSVAVSLALSPHLSACLVGFLMSAADAALSPDSLLVPQLVSPLVLFATATSPDLSPRFSGFIWLLDGCLSHILFVFKTLVPIRGLCRCSFQSF